jgi:hypothetical protein
MSAKDAAALLSAISWPVAVLVTFAMLRSPIRRILERYADEGSTLTITVFGQTVALSRSPEGRQAMRELFNEISQSVQTLSPEDRVRFELIRSSGGRQTVIEMFPRFVRDSADHASLRNLRDAKLIRPTEGGRWEGFKHPMVTRFGELVNSVVPGLDAAPSPVRARPPAE